MIYNEEARLWLPEESVKMDRCWRFIRRNTKELDAGLNYVKHRRVAIQAGGHVGIFPNYLSRFFERVITFEPDPQLYECLEKNALHNVSHSNSALYSEPGVGAFLPNINGTGKLDAEGGWTVSTVTLDELELPEVGFIHLDIEGGEIDALRGAKTLITRYSPVLQLEILSRFEQRLYDYLYQIEYVPVATELRDHVFIRRPSDY